MVDYKPADTRRTRAVEIDGCDGGGVVRQEEVAVDSREHGNECQWRDAQTYAQRIERAHRSGLREQHDRHDEEGNGKEERILGDNVGNVTLEECQVAVEESVAHPCNAEYGNQGVYARSKYVALHGILHVGLAHKQDEGGGRHHYNP